MPVRTLKLIKDPMPVSFELCCGVDHLIAGQCTVPVKRVNDSLFTPPPLHVSFLTVNVALICFYRFNGKNTIIFLVEYLVIRVFNTLCIFSLQMITKISGSSFFWCVGWFSLKSLEVLYPMTRKQEDGLSVLHPSSLILHSTEFHIRRFNLSSIVVIEYDSSSNMHLNVH